MQVKAINNLVRHDRGEQVQAYDVATSVTGYYTGAATIARRDNTIATLNKAAKANDASTNYIRPVVNGQQKSEAMCKP